MSKIIWILFFGFLYSSVFARPPKPSPTWVKPVKSTPNPILPKLKGSTHISKKPKTNEIKPVFNKTLQCNEEKLQENLTKIDDVLVNIIELEATELFPDAINSTEEQKVDEVIMKENKTESDISKSKLILSKIETALKKSSKFNEEFQDHQNVTITPPVSKVPSMIPIFKPKVVQHETEETANEKTESNIESPNPTPTEKPNTDEEKPQSNENLILQLFENGNLKPDFTNLPINKQETSDITAPSAKNNAIKPVIVNCKSILSQNLQCQQTADVKPIPKQESDNNIVINKANSFVQIPGQNFQNQAITEAKTMSVYNTGENPGYFGSKPFFIALDSMGQIPSQNIQYQNMEAEKSVRKQETGQLSACFVNTNGVRPLIVDENSIAQILNQILQCPQGNNAKPTHGQEICKNIAPLVNPNTVKPVFVNLNSFGQIQNQNIQNQKLANINSMPTKDNFQNIALSVNDNARKLLSVNLNTQISNQNLQCQKVVDARPMFKQVVNENSAPLLNNNVVKPVLVNLNTVSQNPSQKLQCPKIADTMLNTDVVPKSGNNAKIVIYKPETVSLTKTEGEFLKELTMTVLVPVQISRL